MMRSLNQFDPEQGAEREKYHQIDGQVLSETPVLAGVTETAAGDIDTARFRGNGRADKGQYEQSEYRQSSAIKNPEYNRESAQNFQPRQIKRDADTREPRQHFVIVDVQTELNRI